MPTAAVAARSGRLAIALLLPGVLLAAALASPARATVTLREEPGATFECTVRDCVAPYRAFPARHADRARPRSPASLDAALAAADLQPLPGPTPLDRAAVREAIGVGFLFDGLDARPLTVTTIATRDFGAYVERRLVFSDPEVGEFAALALEPAGDDRVAAVIGLHGHLDTPDVFADRYLGRELAAAGYLVVVPHLRAMDCLGTFGPELEVSRALLEQGFTLIGLRAYETALAARYLRALPRVDPGRLGLLSHSGGSSTGEVAVWLTDDLAAHVIDYHQDWRNRCGFFDSLHCETVPALFPLSASLGDDTRAPLPRLRVPYGFPDAGTRQEVTDWLHRRLRRPYCPRLDRAACDGQRFPARIVRRAERLCRLATRAGAQDGRRRAATLRRARAGWRALAMRLRATPLSPSCRGDVALALRAAARQADVLGSGS